MLATPSNTQIGDRDLNLPYMGVHLQFSN